MSSSKNTRDILIQAAGKLFAEQGLDVPTRQIVQKAHVNLGSIHYYFGCKDNMLDAVLEYATDGWKNHADVLDYLRTSSTALFNSPEGRKEIIIRMYDIMLKAPSFDEKKELWPSKLVHRILTSPVNSPLKKKLCDRIAEPNRLSVNRILKQLCPRMSEDEIHVFNSQFFVMPHIMLSTADPSFPPPFSIGCSQQVFFQKSRQFLIDTCSITLELCRSGQLLTGKEKTTESPATP